MISKIKDILRRRTAKRAIESIAGLSAVKEALFEKVAMQMKHEKLVTDSKRAKEIFLDILKQELEAQRKLQDMLSGRGKDLQNSLTNRQEEKNSTTVSSPITSR